MACLFAESIRTVRFKSEICLKRSDTLSVEEIKTVPKIC